MLKEAIEKIVSLAAPVTFEIDGYTYASQRLERIEEPEDTCTSSRSEEVPRS